MVKSLVEHTRSPVSLASQPASPATGRQTCIGMGSGPQGPTTYTESVHPGVQVVPTGESQARGHRVQYGVPYGQNFAFSGIICSEEGQR